MKTTLDIADDLLMAAKQVAARRRTTLKAVVEHALAREIQPTGDADGEGAVVEMAADGLPRYKRQGKGTVTSAQVYTLMDEEGI